MPALFKDGKIVAGSNSQFFYTKKLKQLAVRTNDREYSMYLRMNSNGEFEWVMEIYNYWFDQSKQKDNYRRLDTQVNISKEEPKEWKDPVNNLVVEYGKDNSSDDDVPF